MWQRNKNERTLLHECPRCRALTKIAVGHTGGCSKCSLTLAVDKDIAKSTAKQSFVEQSCTDTCKNVMRHTIFGRSLRHARGD
jgi:hypothetical protein